MNIAIFFLALVSSLGCYLLVSRRLGRKERSAAVRRLMGKHLVKVETNPVSGPLLMQMADEVRGRLATRLLERLRL